MIIGWGAKMPYDKFTCYVGGQKKYCTKNRKTGQIVHYSSAEKRENGIRVREMYSHGFHPTGLAAANHSTRRRVSSMGGRARRRR